MELWRLPLAAEPISRLKDMSVLNMNTALAVTGAEAVALEDVAIVDNGVGVSVASTFANTMRVSRCVFRRNNVGGGLKFNGAFATAALLISDSHFDAHVLADASIVSKGASINFSGARFELNNTVISNGDSNYADQRSATGAVHVARGSTVFWRSVFRHNNLARGTGAALHLNGNGEHLILESHFLNNTIKGNSAGVLANSGRTTVRNSG